MKIALIFPGITSVGFDSFGKVWESENNFLPHGLALIAACCKEAGHEAEALDLRRLKSWEDFKVRVAASGARVFGLSSMSVDYDVACECARVIREVRPDAKIVIGGVHATVATQEAEGNPRFDHIIIGEGEVAVPKLLSDLDAGKTPPRVIRGEHPDLDALPIPDRELFGYSAGEMKYPLVAGFDPPFATVVANRGCPYQCTFCQPAERMVFGGKMRWRGLDSLFRELNHLRDKYQFKSLMIHDDLFIIRPQPALEFARRYKAEGFTAPFICQGRADVISKNPELIEVLSDAGLKCLLIGFESGSQRILDFIKKGTTVEQNIETVKICRGAGVAIFANIMFGLPTETREEAMRTVEFVRWMKPEFFSPAFFTPHPGSELYEYCKQHDLSLIKDHRGYRRNPTEPKIKGVDYNFLQYAIAKAQEWTMDQRLAYFTRMAGATGRQDLEQQRAQLAHIKNQLAAADRQIGYAPRPPSRFSYLRVPPLKKAQAKLAAASCAAYDYAAVLKATAELIERFGGMRAFVKPGNRVLIKPNLTTRCAPASQIVTHPTIVAALAEHAMRAGAEVIIAETPGGPPEAYANLREIVQEAGYLNVRFAGPVDVLDLGADRIVLLENPDGVVLKEVPVAGFLETIACIVNVPKLKTHRATMLSGAVRNLLGLVPAAGKAKFYEAAGDPARFAEALVDLAAAVCPQLTILDAVSAMHGDGPLGGEVINTGFLAASNNPFALDWWVCGKLGASPERVPTNRIAKERGYAAEAPLIAGPAEEADRKIEGFRWPEMTADAKLAMVA